MRLGKTLAAVTYDDKLVLRRRMIGLEQSLLLDRQRCCGCGDCEVVCPAKAISLAAPVVAGGRVLRKAAVHIDPAACIYCGECAVICPTRAISWRENDNSIPAVIAAGILPLLDEEIRIESEGCRIGCEFACREICPTGAVSVSLEEDESGKARICEVTVAGEKCLYCARCEPACPHGLIGVKKSRTGLVVFNPRACPPGCGACADVCPTGAMGRRGHAVSLDEDSCIYCRACVSVCPAADALEVRREMICARFPTSQLWADILEKIVSPGAKIRHWQESAAMKRARAFTTRID